MKKKVGWNYITVEGYCMKGINPHKDKYNYEVVSMEPLKTKRIPNPHYNPDYKEPDYPSYCKYKILPSCLLKDCPHLAISEVTKRTRDKLRDIYDDLADDEYEDACEE